MFLSGTETNLHPYPHLEALENVLPLHHKKSVLNFWFGAGTQEQTEEFSAGSVSEPTTKVLCIKTAHRYLSI